MGTWIAIIEGHGPHHNNHTSDADQIIESTVDALRKAGHGDVEARLILKGQEQRWHAGKVDPTTPMNPRALADTLAQEAMTRSHVKPTIEPATFGEPTDTALGTDRA